MFIIFGSPRSGTTLLAQCLSAHPELFVPDETDFIIPVAFVFDRINDIATRREILKPLITKSQRFAGSLGESFPEAEICDIIARHSDSFPGLLIALYQTLAARHGAKNAGDKSPNDLMFFRILMKIGGLPPSIKIIHIVRDIRDVLSSLNEQRWNPSHTWFPRYWNVTNLYLHEEFGLASHYCLLRYEDMVRNPLRELARLCIFLGVSCDFLLHMTNHQCRHARYRGTPHHARLYEPISDAAIGRFRASLPDHMIARCERQTAEAMAAFGYSPSGSA